jgi:hypothetical protein
MPVIAPTLVVDVQDGKTTVRMGNQPAMPATVYRVTRTEALLVLRQTVGSTSRVIVIRPVSTTEVRFEMFVEYVDGKQANYYYSETFKKKG